MSEQTKNKNKGTKEVVCATAVEGVSEKVAQNGQSQVLQAAPRVLCSEQGVR